MASWTKESGHTGKDITADAACMITADRITATHAMSEGGQLFYVMLQVSRRPGYIKPVLFVRTFEWLRTGTITCLMLTRLLLWLPVQWCWAGAPVPGGSEMCVDIDCNSAACSAFKSSAFQQWTKAKAPAILVCSSMVMLCVLTAKFRHCALKIIDLQA